MLRHFFNLILLERKIFVVVFWGVVIFHLMLLSFKHLRCCLKNFLYALVRRFYLSASQTVWSKMSENIPSAQTFSHMKPDFKWLSRKWLHVFCHLCSNLYSLIGSRNVVLVSRTLCEVETSEVQHKFLGQRHRQVIVKLISNLLPVLSIKRLSSLPEMKMKQKRRSGWKSQELGRNQEVDQMVVKVCCKIVFCVAYNIKERSKLGLSNINYSFRKAELPVFREVNREQKMVPSSEYHHVRTWYIQSFCLN